MGLASRSTTVLLLLSWVSLCISVDQLTPTKPLTFPDDKLISNNGAFALGFFSPSNSSTRFYIGIWYNNNVVPERTIVWVANRDNPITTPSSAATLAVTNHSDLVLSDPQGHIYWRTTTNNTTAGGGTAAAAMALLNDKGNLVLQSPEGATLWQSFDHPTDTILPGMPVWVNFRTRFTQSLVSWRSADDPSSGDFSLSADVGSGIQYVLKSGPLLLWRSGAWNGEMVLDYTPSKDSAVIIMSIVSNGDDISLMFSVSDGSPSMYLRVSYTGRYEFTVWNTTTSAWIVMIAHPGAGCDRYASCGPFGYCDATEAVATCKCPEGFEPNNGTSPPSGGCRRKEPLGCGAGDYFATLPGVKTPAMPVFVRNRSLDSCTAECRGNCSCTAYAYTNLSTAISGGDLSRCLLWFGDLVDIDKDVNINRENLYLRLAGSSTSTAHKKNNLAKILLPITAFVLLLAFPALVWTYKYRGTRQKKNVQKRLMLEYFRSTNGTGDRNIEFPFIRFDDIIAATDNFSDANMLGKGGFGKVYKGLLEGTNEVAVKRLSKSSGQGTEEFRNEVVLIAKLQHKNLVRLLGCCIHEDEKLLVYEYMPNKSLDCFLFDPARKLMLQWPTRFKIIKGVARGIMYLHQDSRLTIIHRDLKASNILLDKEMIPKISDFGMARIFGGDQHEANTNRVVGTYGYMSPEYAMEGAFSVKSDTYSFGVLLLEIVSGLKISSQNLIIDFPNLIVYAWNLWKDGKIEDVVDSSMKENYSLDEVSRCIHMALLCVQDSPNCRPFMSAVVFMLENKTTPLPLPIPMQPVYFASRDTDPGRAGKDRVFSVNDMSLTALEGR
ncbi:unnamed protein product [Urochloa decumbens]|uniref:Receptor-like serine/threonine-protein kinase n=1 Tax=Urochloa decumbens TaxID=240449 RepID=A0ABC9H381_9POAL